MRPKVFTVAGSAGGATYSPAYPIDTYNNPCNIGVAITVSGAECIADCQHTFGDPWATNLSTSVSSVPWINLTALTSVTAANNINGTTDGSYLYPPRAIRMRVRALTSAGAGNAATLTIQQAGPE